MIPSWAARALLFGPWRAEAATVQYMRDRAVAGPQDAVMGIPAALKPLRELTPAEIYDRFGPPDGVIPDHGNLRVEVVTPA